MQSQAKLLIVGVIVLAIVCVAAFLVFATI